MDRTWPRRQSTSRYRRHVRHRPRRQRGGTPRHRPLLCLRWEEWAQYGIDSALTSPDQITAAVAEFAQNGCDELILTGNNTDPGQVDLLADALGW
nr:hypothetical protein [Micromonospora endophytica]